MRDLRRYPHGSQRRNNPNAFASLYSHDALRREKQLVFNVGMAPDYVAVSEVPRSAGHLGNTAAVLVEEKCVARLRHLLS
jgi:hypothetical protein